MLGDKISLETGKVTGRRVLPNAGGGPRVETSFQASGTLLGINEQAVVTYCANMRPDGTLYGEGQGVVLGEGGELATWVGQGVGTMRKDGGFSYRGAVFYQSTTPKWSRLNSIATVFEYEVDTQGNTKGESWEWK